MLHLHCTEELALGEFYNDCSSVMARPRTDLYKKTVSTNVTYQCCSETENITNVGTCEVEPHSQHDFDLMVNFGRLERIDFAACFAIVHAFPIRAPLSESPRTLDVCSCAKVNFESLYPLRCLRNCCAACTCGWARLYLHRAFLQY